MRALSRIAIVVGCLFCLGCNTNPSPTVTPKPETTTTAAGQSTTAAKTSTAVPATTTSVKPADDKDKPAPKPADPPQPRSASSAGENPPTKAQILFDLQKKIGDGGRAFAEQSDESKKRAQRDSNPHPPD